MHSDLGSLEDALTDPLLRQRLYRYASSMCGSGADAEDIVQETLAAALPKVHQLRNAASIASWACRIARNVYLQRQRTSVFAPQRMLSIDEITASVAAREPHPHRIVLARVRIGAVRDAMRRLPPHYRSVMLLRDFAELSTNETAVRLGLTADVTKSRLHRAHAMIRELCADAPS